MIRFSHNDNNSLDQYYTRLSKMGRCEFINLHSHVFEVGSPQTTEKYGIITGLARTCAKFDRGSSPRYIIEREQFEACL